MVNEKGEDIEQIDRENAQDQQRVRRLGLQYGDPPPQKVARKANAETFPLDLPRFSPRMLFDPATNIHLGTYYIRHLLNSLEGNWHEALAAYNGGRTRVIKWRTFAQYREPAEFIETIPFDETRGYVQSVLRNAAVYRQLYDGKAAAIAYPDPPPAPAPVAAAGKPPARKPAAHRRSRH